MTTKESSPISSPNIGSHRVKKGNPPRIMIGLGCLTLALCGSGFYLLSTLKNNNAIEIRKATEAVTQIDIPPDFPPAFYVRLPFTDLMFAVYGKDFQQVDSPRLILFSFPEKMAPNESQIRAQIQQSLNPGGPESNSELVRAEPRTFLVDGKPHTIEIEHRTTLAGRPLVQIDLPFKNRQGGPAVLSIRVPRQLWDEGVIDRLIHSMK